MHFVSLFFLNERNVTTSLLMIHLKCTVVHSNLNPSSVNNPFLNYGPLNMQFLFFFFRFFIYVYYNENFAKEIMNQLSFFNANFWNSFQNVVYYKILGRVTLWYWKGGTLNVRQNLKKMASFLWSKIVIFDMFFKRLCKESFEGLEFNNNWKFQIVMHFD